jgi:glycopeptide antibiotics resistance protein
VRSKRPAITKLSLVIILIPIGILTKVYAGIGSEFITNYLGGVIYVVFFIVLTSLVFPKASSRKISLIILCVTCMLEFSQLIHNPTLDQLRKNFVFRALFGSTFNPFDFIWYFVGAITGFFLVLFINKIPAKK